MHIGFSYEERRRINPKELSKLYIKKYPLVDMKWERNDSYKYILEVWGLDTKASACCFCPFLIKLKFIIFLTNKVYYY